MAEVSDVRPTLCTVRLPGRSVERPAVPLGAAGRRAR